MSINATIDGTVYNGIQRITTGGKTVLLSETGSGLPSGITLLSGQPATVLTGEWDGISYDYSNSVPTYIPIASVAKIETRFKVVRAGSSGTVWVTAYDGPSSTAGGGKYIGIPNVKTWSGGSVTTNEEVDGVTHIVVEGLSDSGANMRLAGFGAAGWASTIAYYEFKAWDANGNLLCDLKTAKIDSINKVGLWDAARSVFLYGNAQYENAIYAGIPSA